MSTSIHRRVEAARAGTNPNVVCRVPAGWVVMGDSQLLAGYCLLLPDPVVTDLNALAGEARLTFLADMATLGDAILEVTGAVRINYEILGNLDPALHAHAFPRYATEPESHRTLPPLFYDQGARDAVPFDPELHRPLMERIAEAVRRRLGSAADGATDARA